MGASGMAGGQNQQNQQFNPQQMLQQYNGMNPFMQGMLPLQQFAGFGAGARMPYFNFAQSPLASHLASMGINPAAFGSGNNRTPTLTGFPPTGAGAQSNLGAAPLASSNQQLANFNPLLSFGNRSPVVPPTQSGGLGGLPGGFTGGVPPRGGPTIH